MDIDLTLSRSIREQFLDGVPDQEIEVLDMKMWKSRIMSMSLCLIDMFCRIPLPSRISPEEVRKVLSVWTNGSSAKWYNAHSPKMMLALIVGLYRVSTGVPLMVQGIVEVGEPIWRISGDNSSYLDHLLFIMAVNFLTFSLWKAASIGSVEAMGTSGFLLQK